MSFQDSAVLAEEVSIAAGVAAEEKVEREREEAQKKANEELYEKYFGEKDAVTVSDNEAIFKVNNHVDLSAGDEGTEINPDDPAFLRAPIDDGAEAYYGDLKDVGSFYKTYEVSPGKYRTVITSYPNTFDDDGRETEIDNTLVETDPEGIKSISGNDISGCDNAYTNKANSVDIVVAGNEDSGVVSIKDEDTDIFMQMDDADFSKESVSGNAIRYNDVYKNIDIQYSVKNNGVKEDIILLERSERGSFTYSLSSDGITAKEKNGTITIYNDGETKKEKEKTSVSSNSVSENTISSNSISDNDIPYAYISAPVMKDAVGATSDKIELKLNESDDGYEVVLIPDQLWKVK